MFKTVVCGSAGVSSGMGLLLRLAFIWRATARQESGLLNSPRKIRARCWTPGNMLVQGAFYWGQLIELLCAMRPGEIAQLRCRDVLELNGRPHFRYARFSVAQEKENQFAPKPGGNRGKTAAAFRWVTIHWVLLRLGIVDRRDAIVESYVERKIGEAGGRKKLTATE